MKHLLTRDNVATLDRACNDEANLSPTVLMESAGRAAANILQALLPSGKGLRMLIACGGGNNGGDGLVIARHLRDVHDVVVLRNDDAEWDDLVDAFDVVVDALVGVGGGADLRAPASEHVAVLNGLRGLHVAIDVPTGLDATTGVAHRNAFRAHATITMVAAKPGFYRNDGPSHVGTVYIADIGTPFELSERISKHFVFTPADIRTWLPARPRTTSKFDYGRVLVIGGSRPMRGAPALTAHAALVAGAGLVELAAPVLHPLIPREVMTHVLSSTAEGNMARNAFASIGDIIKKATVLAIGPGLGPDTAATAALAEMVNALPVDVPVVIDADGLRIMPHLNRPMANIIVTPHLGEFARMLNTDVATIKQTIVERAMAYASERGCVVHVKDVPSVTTNGVSTAYTVNGNPGMATAGSGDVLTGLIAGLCAQKVDVFHAAALGAFLHARAGDYYASNQAMETLTASDLIHSLGSVIPT